MLLRYNYTTIFNYKLDADEKYPDCVFVEDTVVVIGKTVLVSYYNNN